MEQLRWLEIEQEYDRNGEPIRIIDKLLVAEDSLTTAGASRTYLRKLWHYHSHSRFKDPKPRLVDLTASEPKALGEFLPPALEAHTELESINFVTPAGELSCVGARAVRRETDDSAKTETLHTFTVYSNPQSPFGCLLFSHIAETKNGDRERPMIIETLTLKEIGANAVSSFPELK